MRDVVVFVGLAIGGIGALVAAGWLLSGARAPRPAGEGEVGELSVYVQTPYGPRALVPEQSSVLPRPQALVFEWNARGLGPRLIRIEAEWARERRHLYEARVIAPTDGLYLDYVARLGERAPDALTLVVYAEAPHAAPKVRRFPIQLVTENHRFWDRNEPP